MLRNLLRPRLWWLLVLPLIFHLTRKAYLSLGSIGVLLDVHYAKQIAQRKPGTVILYYAWLGIHLEPPVYDVVSFVMNACLVIGCLSLLKELFLEKPKVPAS